MKTNIAIAVASLCVGITLAALLPHGLLKVLVGIAIVTAVACAGVCIYRRFVVDHGTESATEPA